MATTAIVSQIGNGSQSRVFSDNSTDGSWTNITSSNSQAIGLEMPQVLVTTVQVSSVANTTGLWRIIDGRTLVVRRIGFTYSTPYGCIETSQIAPYQVQPQDLFQTYTNAASASHKNNAVGLLHTPSGIEPFGFSAADDGAATAVLNLNTGQTLGDYAFSSSLLAYEFQLDAPHDIQTLEVIDQTGGTIYTAYGNVRLPAAGGKSLQWNIQGSTSIPIMKGYTLKLTCESND